MKVLNVTCNNCGAPLEVPQKTRFLTCTFCNSRLEIQKSGNAYFTNVLEAVSEMKENVETIKLQNALERVDREWSMERESFMSTDKHGRSHVPSATGGIAMLILGVVVGGLFLANAPGDISGFGVLFIGVGVLGGVWTLNRAKNYGDRKRRYESRRRELARELRGR